MKHLEQKKVIDVGTGTITIYYGSLGNPYIEVREGYEGNPTGLYLEYEECIDELMDALRLAKEQRAKITIAKPV